jgi:hypothetical protein
MSTPLRSFVVVRVIAIRENRFADKQAFYSRLPKLGDIGTILEVYARPEPAYEVECSDPSSGATLWLEAMYPDEIEACSDKSAVP